MQNSLGSTSIPSLCHYLGLLIILRQVIRQTGSDHMWRVKKKDKSFVKLSTKQKLQNDRSLLCITPCLTAAGQFNYQNLTVKFLARRIFQFLTDFCSWQFPVPCKLMFLADSYSWNIHVPGRLKFLANSYSIGKITVVKPTPVPRRLTFLAGSCSWKSYVLAVFCSWQTPLPIADSCSYSRFLFLATHVPGRLKLQQTHILVP